MGKGADTKQMGGNKLNVNGIGSAINGRYSGSKGPREANRDGVSGLKALGYLLTTLNLINDIKPKKTE